MFRGFHQSLQTCRDSTSVRPWPLSSKSFPIHHSSVILPFDCIVWVGYWEHHKINHKKKLNGNVSLNVKFIVYRKYPLTISLSYLWTYEPYSNFSLNSATKWIYFSAWTYMCSCITHQQIWDIGWILQETVWEAMLKRYTCYGMGVRQPVTSQVCHKCYLKHSSF
jgi:hypothetical protein